MGAKSEMVPNGDNMNVLKGVKDILGGPDINIILRSTTEAFWEACILTADQGHRVCAIGSPGIGKSTTTPVLIKLLLGKGVTVVYLKRTRNKSGFYYQFTPNVATGVPDVMLFSEETTDTDIEALKQNTTFFIIDPDKTADTCDPSVFVMAHVIINASPANGHWGGNEFAKARGGYVGGLFLFFPLWSLVELLAAAQLINAAVDAETVRSRYRLVGGVPRSVFGVPRSVEPALKRLRVAVSKLSPRQAMSIATGNVAELETSDDTQPQSAIMGYSASPDFTTGNVVIISDVARELVVTAYADHLWTVMLAEIKSSPRGYLFESYVRNLMLQPGEYQCRAAVGKTSKRSESRELLGGCLEIRLVADVVQAVRDAEPGIVFHSCNDSNPLLDFIYKTQTGTEILYTAVNPTVGLSHDAASDKIASLAVALSIGKHIKLRLVYAVPMAIFQSFTTKPVSPSTPTCRVLVFGFPKPSDQAVGGGAAAGGGGVLKP
jgi:hypothetical protein